MAIDFLDFIEDTNSAETAEEIFHLFETALAKLGFDRVLYSVMTDHNSVGIKAGHGIMRNYSDDWMQHYTEKKYSEIDPVRRHVMLSSQPFVWDDMGKTIPYTREEKCLLQESKEAGLHSGVGLGVHCVGGESVGLGFASSHTDVEVTPTVLSLIKALANQFHFAYMEFHKKTGTALPSIQTNLSRREREVLKWCAIAKSPSEIATILSLSTNTVDYYIRQIFQKLEVNSKILAVVKAIKHGLIQV